MKNLVSKSKSESADVDLVFSRRTILSSILAVGASTATVKSAFAQCAPLFATDPVTVVTNAACYFNFQLLDNYFALIDPNVMIYSVNKHIKHIGKNHAWKELKRQMTTQGATQTGARFYLNSTNLQSDQITVKGDACWVDFDGTPNDHLTYVFQVVSGKITYMETTPDGLWC